MSTTEEVEAITHDIAVQALRDVGNIGVHATEEADWQGEASFHVVVVLPDEAFSRDGVGDKFSNIALSVWEGLVGRGDNRFPYVDFTARSESGDA